MKRDYARLNSFLRGTKVPVREFSLETVTNSLFSNSSAVETVI